MRNNKKLTILCAFCEKVLSSATNKNKKDATLVIICKECEKPIVAELGKDWQSSNWWQEYRLNYIKEQVDRARDRDWSTETLVDQEVHGYLRNIPKATIKGTSIEVHPGNIHMIITRLYKAYGYGSRQMATILKRTYRINITFRAIEYHLEEIKSEGIIPDESARQWKAWHMHLYAQDKKFVGAGA